MDTATQPPAGEQPAVTPDQPTAGAQPANRSVEPAASSLENLSSAELLAALEATEYGEASTENEEQAEPDEPEAPPVEEEAPTPAAEDEIPPAAEPENTTENKPLRRLPLGGIAESQRNEFAEAANLIREGKAKDLAEAVALLRGTPPQETQQPTPTEQAPPTPQTPASVAAIQQQIATLREQRDQADDEFDKPTVRKLTNEIEDLQVSLVRAELAERENRAQANTWEAAHDKACDEVEAKYAEFAKTEPDFYQMLEDRRLAMEARNDPALKDPKFIIAEAEKIAGKLGWNKPAPPAPKAKATVPNGQSLAPAHDSASRLTRADAQRMIQDMPIDDLRKAVCTE